MLGLPKTGKVKMNVSSKRTFIEQNWGLCQQEGKNFISFSFFHFQTVWKISMTQGLNCTSLCCLTVTVWICIGFFHTSDTEQALTHVYVFSGVLQSRNCSASWNTHDWKRCLFQTARTASSRTACAKEFEVASDKQHKGTVYCEIVRKYLTVVHGYHAWL